MSALSQLANMSEGTVERQGLERQVLPKEYTVQVTLFEYQGCKPKTLSCVETILCSADGARTIFEKTISILRQQAETVELGS